MPRALWVTDVPPAETGAGGQVGLFGNALALERAGFSPAFAVVGHRPEGWTPDPSVSFTGVLPADTEAPARLGEIVERVRPDVVWVFHTIAWPAFAPQRERWPHVLLSGDPAWEIERLRWAVRAKPRGPARKVVYRHRHGRLVGRMRALELDALRQAAEHGVVAGWSRRDVDLMAGRAGVEVGWCPLAFPGWPAVTPNGEAWPQVLQLGNMSSVHTRYGLRHFFDEIWPVWSTDPEPPRSAVRVVGGGRLPDGFAIPPDDPRLQWVGFVPSLEDEWAGALAMLVTVPLDLGFRTRIIESWARGVPVISHPSAAVNLPMMKAGGNFLAASRPQDWIDSVRRLEADAAARDALSHAGRATYEEWFEPGSASGRFASLTERAITRFARREAVPR